MDKNRISKLVRIILTVKQAYRQTERQKYKKKTYKIDRKKLKH